VLFRAVYRDALFAAFGARAAASSTAGDAGIPIWTTTPWTLPANEAVAVHAELEYVLVAGEAGGRPLVLVLARDLLGAVSARIGLWSARIRSRARPRLEHLRLHHPFYGRDVPVISAT
jgi:isoleucyl-tRNA synthetase